MTARRRVSVIIPVFNGEALIRDALASVLAQSRPVDEIIVVDDGSSDASGAVVAGLGVPGLTLVRQENRGPAAARNQGLGLASGDVIAFLDADDQWAPEKLAVQVPLLERPDVRVVIGQTEGVALEEKVARRAFRSSWGSRQFLQLGAMLFRADVFSEVGPFDESLRFGEDIDWCLRAQERAVVIHPHEETVLSYRRHGGNMTNDTRARDRDFLRVLKKAIDRKRRPAVLAASRRDPTWPSL